ncbi:MAG TPA: hypothetical protein VM657_12020 [Sphingomonas sp.]|nr:hypothetical protein [Sphingomonas sp.]
MTILGKVEHFLRRSDMPRTRFGRIAVNDPRLVDDLRRGREPGPRTVARIEAALETLDGAVR